MFDLNIPNQKWIIQLWQLTHLVQDYTHAQIIPVIQILGNSIFIPTYIYDFTTDWIGQDMWRRSSTVFQTWRPPTGHYLWKRIINADGSKGPWYDKGWLTYKDGVPVAVPIAMVPPLWRQETCPQKEIWVFILWKGGYFSYVDGVLLNVSSPNFVDLQLYAVDYILLSV